MGKWAIKSKGFNEDETRYEYYTGKSYIYQGNRYLISSKEEEEAKTYTSYKRAETAMNKIKDKFENSWEMQVVQLSND